MNMTNISFVGRSELFRIPAPTSRECCFSILLGFCKMSGTQFFAIWPAMVSCGTGNWSLNKKRKSQFFLPDPALVAQIEQANQGRLEP
jgi:hypothetical protein